MVMTQEMEIWAENFKKFLLEVDEEYSEYFASGECQANSILDCFAILNGANLRAIPRNLRQDIYNKVINKHKEIWGHYHHFDVAGS